MAVPGFLSKTYEIFNSPEFSECCGWGPNGDTIIIKKIDLFCKIVLPKFFKHANYQSFVRQLNMYDFHKTVQDPTNGEFQHQYFIKNRPDLLVHIKRKAHNKSEPPPVTMPLKKNSSSKLDHGYSKSNNTAQSLHPTVENETEVVLNELEQQSAMRSELDKRLSALEKQHGQILNENMYLRNMVIESANKQAMMQERMEKIFRALYVYMNGNNTNLPPQLLGRTQSMMLTDGSINPKLIDLYSSPQITDFSANNPSDQANISRLESLPPFPDIGDEFGLGLDLRHQSSFDSAAASVTAPSDPKELNHIEPNLSSASGPNKSSSLTAELTNMPISPMPIDNLNLIPTSSFAIDNELPGAGLRRLASLNEYRPSSGVSGSGGRKRDNHVVEYTSDRVTELTSESFSEKDAKLPPSKKVKNEKDQASNISLASSFDNTSNPTGTAESQNILQPQIDYIQLLQKNQETTLARMDSLEMTIASLLNEDFYDDQNTGEETSWGAEAIKPEIKENSST